MGCVSVRVPVPSTGAGRQRSHATRVVQRARWSTWSGMLLRQLFVRPVSRGGLRNDVALCVLLHGDVRLAFAMRTDPDAADARHEGFQSRRREANHAAADISGSVLHALLFVASAYAIG